jgi:hypothetical protein
MVVAVMMLVLACFLNPETISSETNLGIAHLSAHHDQDVEWDAEDVHQCGLVTKQNHTAWNPPHDEKQSKSTQTATKNY